MSHIKRLSDTFRILGAPPRLEIISLLIESSPLCVDAITRRLKISQSAVSQHLRVLKMAGWVKAERMGCWMHYSLNKRKLRELHQSVERLAGRRRRVGSARDVKSGDRSKKGA